MSAGSYMPSPVRAVEIPKDHGTGVRVLGVPTTADRVAQTAVAMLLEEKLEPIFHPDSYGYRPGRSAHDALAVTRRRCWEKDWVLDLDIRSFFDSVPHDLLLKAVAHHTRERWVLLYIERWLKAPMRMPDGTLVAREKRYPARVARSRLCWPTCFMTYAFDRWMAREHPGCPFERYADDIVVHCDTEKQARRLWVEIAKRLKTVGLELHPEKTKVVYCKDTNRRGRLGAHQLRLSRLYLPGTCGARTARLLHELRASHRAQRHERRSARRSGHGIFGAAARSDLSSIAAEINPQVRGWIGYYGAFYRSELHFLAFRIDQHLVRWARHKFKRLRYSPVRAWAWLAAVKRREPGLFAHWQGAPPPKGRPARAV